MRRLSLLASPRVVNRMHCSHQRNEFGKSILSKTAWIVTVDDCEHTTAEYNYC